jgi:hypothetical protein
MEGIKDFKLVSQDNINLVEDWNVSHIQHGFHGEREVSERVYSEPKEGHDNLIAAFEGSELDHSLHDLDEAVIFGTATLVCYNLDLNMFGNTVMTNEI